MEEDNKYIRLDKNLTRNANLFSKFGERENLVTSLYVYFCENAQRDIFGKFRLDPEEFMVAMGYKSRSKLFQKVKVPYKLAEFKDSSVKLEKEKQKLLKLNDELFDSVLGDALYMMMAMNLILVNGRSYNTEDGDSKSLESHQIIKKLTVYRNPKRKNKIYYDISLNEDLIANLKHYFDHINKKTFISCREINLHNLYFYITSLREFCISKNLLGSPTFDFLCSLANVNDTDISHRKKKLKVKILNLLKLDPSLNFSFTYIKREKDTYEFQPEFKFHFTDDERISKAILINQEKTVFVINDIEKKLYELFKTRYSNQFDINDKLEFDSKYRSWKEHLMSDKDDKLKIILSSVKHEVPKNYSKWTNYPDGPGSNKEKVYNTYFKTGNINTRELY